MASTVVSAPPPGAARATGRIVIEEKVAIPGGFADLESFRQWARSDDFPERGRYCYLQGELWVDLSMEQFFSHSQVKHEFSLVPGGLIKSNRSGYYCPDGTLLSVPAADLSTEPDGAFVSFDAIQTNRVRLVRGATEGYVELEGSPEMVLEIVSPTSVRKDTVLLREMYWQAGVTEYWLVDARGAAVRFDIFRRGSKGFIAARRQGGWLKSAVFGRSFQLTQQTDPLGHPQFTLAVQEG